MTTPGLGIDVSGVADLDLMLSYSDEQKAVAEAVAVSFTHDPGVLWWAPDRGFNLLAALHSDMTPFEVQQSMRVEAEKEERVESAEVVVTDVGARTFNASVKLTLINNAGDVELTLTASEAGDAINAVIG